MARLEIKEPKSPTAYQIAQLERGQLQEEFGKAIGQELWQYQSGLRQLKNPTLEQKIALMKYAEEALAHSITNGLESEVPLERYQAVKALIRIATINGNK